MASRMDQTEGSEPFDSHQESNGGSRTEDQPSDASQERTPSIQELLARDLTRLIEMVPEETRYHLKRAGTEAGLAIYHLWRRVESEVRGEAKPKVRKRIDIE